MKKKVGIRIDNISVEYYRYSGEESPIMNNIGLRFYDGSAFILGCAGAGGVFVRKGELKVDKDIPYVEDAYIENLSIFLGEKFINVVYEEVSVSLVFETGFMKVINVDDELVFLYEHNCPVKL